MEVRKTKRARGRKGVEQRARRLRREPLCRRCKEKGVITPATEIHHIIPLRRGGSDMDSNTMPLCWECHQEADAETRRQEGGREIGVDGWPKE